VEIPFKVMRILDDEKKLREICSRLKLDERSAEVVSNSKLIIETNGVLMGEQANLEYLHQIQNTEIDIDVSFKDANATV